MSVQITDKQLLDEIAAAKAQADNEERGRIERAEANTEGRAAKADSGVDVLRGILGARGWNERAGQIRMTQYVDEAHDDEDGGVPKRVGIVGVVAPVGTGKTLGYLAPALARGERVIIATSTKALQDQIIGEELPRLREDMINAFGRHITYSVMKGKANYACLQHVDETIARFASHLGTSSDNDLLGGASGDTELDGLVRISRHTRLAMARGDVVNFDTDLMLQRLSEDTRRGVTAKHACPIRRIPLEDCNVCVEGSGAEGHCQKIEQIAKDDRDVWRSAYCRAMLADIVVMNTALLVEEVTKQNNKASPAVPSVLEGVGMVVIDEAHHAPGIVTQSFSREINRKSTIAMARALDKRIADLDIETMTTMFFNSIDAADEEIKKISEFSEYAAKTCNAFAEQASALLDRKARGATETKGKSQAAVTEFRDDVIDTIKEIGGLAARKSVRGETSVHSARLSVDFLPDGSDFTLTAVPIDVSFFRERLVSAMSGVGTHSVRPKSKHKTIVLCSGTMNATTPRLLGFGGGSIVKTVESPFDPQRARLCVPADLPLPKTEEWEAAAWAKAEQAILATEGRTLFLCTSNKMVQAFSLRAKSLPFTVLKQGDGSRADLVRRFAQDEHSVLVATMGYWEGIDVPGPALSLVVLDKIPFPVPSDPIATARREWVEAEGGNAFSIVDVGHASTMLAQGSGRLIRSESDAGGVLILDSRLANARYGSMALSQIERGWLFYRSLDPFLDWMKAVTAAHALGDTESVLDYRRDAEPIRARRKEFVR
ncbi:MAG TPA: ATP-dependent DNA helicase [Demequina sp.]|nr:ATP-dependent DNA helicase [Demequina sp.]